MKTLKKELLHDTTLHIGLLLIVLSLAIFSLPDFLEIGDKTNFGIFVLNYFISILFLIIVGIREIPKFRISHFIEKIKYGFLYLILWLISAYSLNRELPVFEQSTTWVQVFLMIQGAVLLLVFVQHKFPKWLQFVFWGFMGITISFHLYLSIYLVPLYLFSLATFFALGISLHSFVPLVFVSTIIIYLLKSENKRKLNFIGFTTGILLSIAVVVGFLAQWNHVNSIINKASDHSLLDDKNDLPEWTVIAQRLPLNSFSEKILKTGLVYSQASKKNWEFFDLPNRNFDEVRKHDPFIMIATFLYGSPNLTSDQQIQILEAMYDSCHKAQERLWSGNNLQTSHILTNVRLYPNLRIGYTEKFITIRNKQTEQSWMRSQEAIYTFHIPEGAVVTSLSLWVNGKEEKAILTSKHKANEAYKTIVGVEKRDPSLVRWQEGNTVSVRVFPCTPDEDRRFKIGISAPLTKTASELVYNNIWFDGPMSQNADETIRVHCMDNVDLVSIPSAFIEENINTWQYEGSYLSDWKISLPVIPVQQNAFSFDGKTYQISDYEKMYATFDPTDIYLDINKEWTKEEFEMVRKSAASKRVFVYLNQLVQVTDQNAEKLFDRLTLLNFSVFPIYEIANSDKSLLITKGSISSPNVADLGESEFADKLKKYALEHKPIKLYSLNQSLSPYLKTLKELRVFEYDSGSPADLNELLASKRFVANQENSNSVVINDASIKITESDSTTSTSNAPDHLMRLFAYNQVMFLTGTNYFDKDFFDSTIVDNAYKAYVVSPVSSLIVLETAQDYERFGIDDNGVSLKNASMKSSGAVPEPHEWLLIIVITGVVAYLYYKKRYATQTRNAA